MVRPQQRSRPVTRNLLARIGRAIRSWDTVPNWIRRFASSSASTRVRDAFHAAFAGRGPRSLMPRQVIWSGSSERDVIRGLLENGCVAPLLNQCSDSIRNGDATGLGVLQLDVIVDRL